MTQNKNLTGKSFGVGMRDGIPIALGYLPVSFSFGIMAVKGGIPILTAIIISMTNLTSAGQVAGLSILTAGGAFAEMALTELIINLRYSLMAVALSQKLDRGFNLLHRLLCAFCLTDEIFAVAASKKGEVSRGYMYGLLSLPYVGWTVGTLLGAVAGELLPERISAALGIAIYGMFIAIIVPPSCERRGVLFTVICSALISCAIEYIPVFSGITQGFAVIICGVAASVTAALLFPIDDKEEVEE